MLEQALDTSRTIFMPVADRNVEKDGEYFGGGTFSHPDHGKSGSDIGVDEAILNFSPSRKYFIRINILLFPFRVFVIEMQSPEIQDLEEFETWVC